MFEDFVKIDLGIFMDGEHYTYVGTGVYEHEILKDCNNLNDGVTSFSKSVQSWEKVADSKTCQLLISIDDTEIITDKVYTLTSLIDGGAIKVFWDFMRELTGRIDIELCTGKMLREILKSKSKISSDNLSGLKSLLNATDNMSK